MTLSLTLLGRQACAAGVCVVGRLGGERLATLDPPDAASEVRHMTFSIRQPYVRGNIGYVPVGRDAWAKVDAKDLPRVCRYLWRLGKRANGRAFADLVGARGGMHRVVLDVPIEINVFHLNGDGLDNRRCNLRTRRY